ncbi:MAG TPA: hypothetical protein VG055_08700 [Planctomycetaceae bacterium]|nr:hypothetical protein [Planctomycetaceae bacterium]
MIDNFVLGRVNHRDLKGRTDVYINAVFRLRDLKAIRRSRKPDRRDKFERFGIDDGQAVFAYHVSATSPRIVTNAVCSLRGHRFENCIRRGVNHGAASFFIFVTDEDATEIRHIDYAVHRRLAEDLFRKLAGS